MTQAAQEADSAKGLLDFAGLVALATAMDYATGWIYAYYYFGNFQLGLLGLEIPAEYHLMYGFQVVQDWWFIVLPLALLILYLSTKPGLTRHPALCGMHGNHLIVLLILLCGIGLAFSLGKATANSKYQEQRTGDFPSYPQTRVWLKPVTPEDAEYKTLSLELPQGCYRLLLQNSDKLYLFLAPPDQAPARLAVVEIPLAEVAALRILPQYSSC